MLALRASLWTDPMSDQLPAATALSSAADPEHLTASLSERCRGRLVLFAARRLRGDRMAAEDVVQDAFRTVLEALRSGRIRDPEALPAFAYETVKNLCMHHGRSAGRQASTLERFAIAPPTAAPDDVLTNVINEQRRQAVRAAVDRLEPDDRRMLEMTYVEARTSDDIGRELGLTAVAVRVRRHRALQRLGQQLGVTVPRGRE